MICSIDLLLLCALAGPVAGEVAAPLEDEGFTPGLWGGGYGSLELEDGRWMSITLLVDEVKPSGRFSATAWVFPGKAEVEGRAREGRFELRVEIDGRDLVLDGRCEGGEIRGELREGREREAFLLVRQRTGDLRERDGFDGLYETEGGGLLCVQGRRQLALEDLEAGDWRTLYAVEPDRYVAGPALSMPRPVSWEVDFERDGDGATRALVLRRPGREAERARRLPTPLTEDFAFESEGVTLRGSLHTPPTEGPHPAVVWVHGSGRSTRLSAGHWHDWFTHHGFAFLAVDKRGVGDSEGEYELPDGGHDNLPHMRRRARDVRAAVAALAADPRIEGERIGLVGVSQAGWVIPTAACEGGVEFTVVISGGATALSYESVFSDVAQEMRTGPALPSIEDALARTRRHVARDPDLRTELAGLPGPGLWLYGDRDRSNPTQLCVELLESVQEASDRDFTIVRFPAGNHSLLECRWGGAAESGALQRRVPGLYRAIEGWLESRELLPR